MNRKGFTLVELLGVIIILSIIMLIAIPNISSMLERGRREQFISDAKKLVSITEYELRKGTINKPGSNELLKIRLSYLSTNDISKDPEGNLYDINNSYVVVVRNDGYLKYYVNLVSTNSKSELKGIRLTDVENLDLDNRYERISKVSALPSDNEIKSITGMGTGTNLITY